jgi:hypothetical protein
MINLEKYILECIEKIEEEVPEDRLKPVSTPATNYLFKIRKESGVGLSKKKASLFHSTAAKLLFVTK